MSNLLPADRYLASLLGISDEDYARYKAEVYKRAAEGPQPSVVAGIDPGTLAIISLVLTTLSVGFTIAASFFKPQADDTRPAQLRARSRGGRSRTENERFAPRYGFDSTQDITTLGSVIPLVYALREASGGITYGGVRVNTPLLWSQLISLGGSQMLRAIFLIGEGPINAIDVKSFAAGGNTLTSYDYGSATAAGSRMTVYGRYTTASGLTSRINSADYIFGRDPSTDRGNSSNSDIYLINCAASFSSATRPSNQTTFGVYNLIGNDLGFRLNPTIKPTVQAQLIPDGDDGDAKVKCTVDEAAFALKKKSQTVFASRAAITSSGLGSLGGATSYTLYSTSDKDTGFGRDVKSLANPSDWVFSVDARFAKQGAGTFTKAINKGFAQYYDDTEDENTTILNNLQSRISASISGPITVDSKGKGSFNVNISFNTGVVGGISLEDSNDGNENLNQYLQTLKAIRFVLKWKNDLSADDPEDDVIVRYPLQILVKTKVKQQFTADGGTVSAPTLSVSKNADGVVTDVSIAGGGGSIAGLSTTQTFTKPRFKFKRTPRMITNNGKQEPPNAITATVALQFNAKKAYIETADDVAASVAGRQKTWDESLIEGELYKIGSGLAVCSGRTDTAFVSEADLSSGSGTPITATFTTVRTGAVTTNTAAQAQIDGFTWNESRPNVEFHNVATTDGHILRCAIASLSTTRACKIVELGIRSSLGIRIGGICNFKEALGFDECDNRACLDYKNDIVEKGSTLKTDNFQSNTISAPVERYSFFAIYYREAGSTGSYTKLSNAYGVRGATQQNIFNSIQLEMPAIKQWEIQIEPYSGWEIRNGSPGTLYVLDASLTSQQTVSDSGLTVRFAGTTIARTEDSFAITVGRRRSGKGSLNIARTDDAYANGDFSYIDTWGKLAEAFVFEEIQSSAANGPEHEVVYLNEIVPNTTAPLYDNLAILGVNIKSSVEWQQFSQFSCYVTQGKTCRRLLSSNSVGSSHLFPDILLDLLTSTSYGMGNLISDSMIDFTTFADAAQWCQDRKYFYDGVIADRLNLRQWAADTAAAHLLIFGESDGKFFLRRALPTTAVSIKGLFTAGNIAEGSFQLQYFDPEDRDPIQISVRYREERASTDVANPGLFPVVRELLVSEAGTPEDATTQNVDVSDFCTNPAHAVDAAKFIIRMRRIPTHTIRFTTTHEGVLSKMAPSDYIRVAMDETEYDEFNNGVVTAEGALVSTKSLADGTYDVIAWNGEAATAPFDTTLTVSNGGTTATPTGVVFTVKIPSKQVRTYQIERISPNDDGTFTIEAVHMPTNSSGILEIAENFELGSITSSANWTIRN
jgi:hypothetical protein